MLYLGATYLIGDVIVTPSDGDGEVDMFAMALTADTVNVIVCNRKTFDTIVKTGVSPHADVVVLDDARELVGLEKVSVATSDPMEAIARVKEYRSAWVDRHRPPPNTIDNIAYNLSGILQTYCATGTFRMYFTIGKMRFLLN